MLSQLIAGDALNYPIVIDGVEDGKYLPSEGWAVLYRLAPFTAALPAINLQAAVEGDSYTIFVDKNITAEWKPGTYSYAGWVERGPERYTFSRGEITIVPDPRTSVAGYDSRSTATRALAECEAAMASFNKSGGRIKKYSIAGREMEFQSIADLLTLHSFWRAKVMAEGTSSQIAAGLGNPRSLHVRFVRPA